MVLRIYSSSVFYLAWILLFSFLVRLLIIHNHQTFTPYINNIEVFVKPKTAETKGGINE